MEMLMVGILAAVFVKVPCQTAAGNDRLLVAEINSRLVQGNRVKGGQHTDIRNNRNIVFGMTVTER